jgi:hypothetical protein
MATSRNTGQPRDSTFTAFRDGLPNLSRYDLLLLVIPLSFGLTLLGHAVFGVSLRLSVLGGSLMGALAVADALFVHPPLGGGDSTP